MLTNSLNDFKQSMLEKCKNNNSTQCQIDADVHFEFNSLHLVVGKCGSGKTFNTLIEIVYVQDLFSQVIYISNNYHDATFAEFSKNFVIPIIRTTYDKTYETINNIRECRQALEQAIDNGVYDDLTDECKQELVKGLYQRPELNFNDIDVVSASARSIDELSKKPMIIVFDDAINLFKDPKSSLYRLLFENRHMRATIFMLMQSFKGITPEIKANIGGIWLFGGYNQQQWTYIKQQLPACSLDISFSQYATLSKNNFLYINARTDEIEVV